MNLYVSSLNMLCSADRYLVYKYTHVCKLWCMHMGVNMHRFLSYNFVAQFPEIKPMHAFCCQLIV